MNSAITPSLKDTHQTLHEQSNPAMPSELPYHPQLGFSVPDRNWWPAPSYLLRRHRVLFHLDQACVGTLLEIGCGAGALLRELSLHGIACTALETSAPALQLARFVNADRASIYAEPQPNWPGAFDVILAMEVLEHIEDDDVALRLWHTWCKPGGMLLLSVPAHPSKWSASDVWAGHYRRYTRSSIGERLAASGFMVEVVECYGFPLANLLRPLRTLVHMRRLAERNLLQKSVNRAYHTQQSGIERQTEARLFPFMRSLPGRVLLRAACAMQTWSLNWERGDGYFVCARKPPEG